MKCELNKYVYDCDECGFCEEKRKIEREEVLKAIRTIKECCEQNSEDDCLSSDCIIYDWCKKDRNHAPIDLMSGKIVLECAEERGEEE